MAKINKTQYIILGFLQDASRTGYEIGHMIKESTAYFWQESDASIYPTLQLLLKEGKVTATDVSVGKRNKKVYTITLLGKKAFFQWFKMPPAPSIQRDEFLLKLFFTNAQTRANMSEHCDSHLIELEAVLRKFQEISQMLKNEFPGKPFWLMTVQNGIAHAEAEINWLKQQKTRNLL